MKLPIAIILAVFAFAPMGEPKKDLEGIERDTKALVHYLQDKKDHKEYCPEIDWKQPPLATYKKEPKSYLPEDCKE
tara:strand:+ start:746 stop:973 length:228 start_codon:yes stop_codon:yes gene_type:complete